MKNISLERKKFKKENSFAILENLDDIELNLTSQYVTIEPSSLGQINEPSPTQTVAGKYISNPLMGEAFTKSLIKKLTQQIVEVLKKDFSKDLSKEADLESSKTNESRE